MRVRFRVLLMLGVAVIWIGCAGSKEAVEETTEDTPVRLSDVETFDPAPYQIEAPEERVFELSHQVPADLMEPSDSSSGNYSEEVVIRSGFRIQIFSGEKKSNADERYNEALTWWQNEYAGSSGARSIFSKDLPVHIEYKAPYYKVRIGDFSSREEAEKALELVRQRFEEAWIVPDQVEIYQ